MMAKKWFGILLGFLILAGTAISCEEEEITLGQGVISGDPFNTGQQAYEVTAYNRSLEAVQTNKLPLYQLGSYPDAAFGNLQSRIITQVQLVNINPFFGTRRQDFEELTDTTEPRDTINENETVKEVFLYIPFLQPPGSLRDTDNDGVSNDLDAEPDNAENDSDGDGLSNAEERILGTNPLNPDTDGDGITDDEDDDTQVNNFPQRLELDSIYGNREVTAQFRVEKSTYFLRDLDPNNNFETAQEYYSNQDLSGFVEPTPLYDGPITISDEQIVFFQEDDPETEEDESLIIDATRTLNPGIRVPLDNEVFQRDILDMEGSSELLSRSNFLNWFRGLQISLESSEPLYMLLDLTQAFISITYEYDVFNSNGTSDDFTDDFISQEERSFNLRLLTGSQASITGNATNTYARTPASAEVLSATGSNEQASRLYIKGSTGNFGQVRLFGEDGTDEDIIRQIRSNNWIINEARLRVPVDRQALTTYGINQVPPRLYLYNTRTNQPLYNPITELSSSNSPLGIFLNYDGLLDGDDGVADAIYEFRITDFVNDVIIRDSINDPIGITATADIGIIATDKGLTSDPSVTEDYPIMAAITPFSTVLFGSAVEEENRDKRIQLILYYTESE